jgi:hypothetical protein
MRSRGRLTLRRALGAVGLVAAALIVFLPHAMQQADALYMIVGSIEARGSRPA